MTNRKPREPFAQETQLFAHAFIHSDRVVVIHILVFACASCIVLFLEPQCSEWKRTTKASLILSELMETITTTTSSSDFYEISKTYILNTCRIELQHNNTK